MTEAPASFMQLAERFAASTKVKRDLETQLGTVNEELSRLQSLLIQMHETSGIGSSVKLASGGTLIVSDKVAAKKTDEAALVAWLDKHGMADMASRTVNTNSLSALVRERLEKGEPAPEGCEVVQYQAVSWRK